MTLGDYEETLINRRIWTQRDQIEWRISRFQAPIARRMVSRDIANQFSALKRLLEGPE